MKKTNFQRRPATASVLAQPGDNRAGQEVRIEVGIDADEARIAVIKPETMFGRQAGRSVRRQAECLQESLTGIFLEIVVAENGINGDVAEPVPVGTEELVGVIAGSGLAVDEIAAMQNEIEGIAVHGLRQAILRAFAAARIGEHQEGKRGARRRRGSRPAFGQPPPGTARGNIQNVIAAGNAGLQPVARASNRSPVRRAGKTTSASVMPRTRNSAGLWPVFHQTTVKPSGVAFCSIGPAVSGAVVHWAATAKTATIPQRTAAIPQPAGWTGRAFMGAHCHGKHTVPNTES